MLLAEKAVKKAITSELKQTLKPKEKIDIASFHNLTAKLKHDLKRYQYRKAKVFEVTEVENFLRDALNKIHLATEVCIYTIAQWSRRLDPVVKSRFLNSKNEIDY